MLVRRIINGWIAVHTLELEFTVCKPKTAEKRDHLDKALTRAQKRFTEAIRELARVRRLQAPKNLIQALKTGGMDEERMIPMSAAGGGKFEQL